MEDSAGLVPTYDALASELIEELGSIAQAVGQPTLNATRGEMAVLHALYHADGPLTPGALADAGAVSSARVANILRALEEKGWVERHHSARDRRTVETSLTAEGLAEAERRRSEGQRCVADVLAELGEADARELVSLIGAVGEIVSRRSKGGAA